MVKDLISKYIECRMNLSPKDSNGATPLDLACVRGFSDINKITNYDIKLVPEGYASHRYHIVKMILAAKNRLGQSKVHITYDSLEKKSNCPLHWAIYWADYTLANLLIQKSPKLIFFENERGNVPFEMVLKA